MYIHNIYKYIYIYIYYNINNNKVIYKYYFQKNSSKAILRILCYISP